MGMFYSRSVNGPVSCDTMKYFDRRERASPEMIAEIRVPNSRGVAEARYRCK